MLSGRVVEGQALGRAPLHPIKSSLNGVSIGRGGLVWNVRAYWCNSVYRSSKSVAVRTTEILRSAQDDKLIR